MQRLDKYYQGSQNCDIRKPRAAMKLFTVIPSSWNIGPYQCSLAISVPGSTSDVEPAPNRENWVLLRYLTKLGLHWDHWYLSWAGGILKHSKSSGQIFCSFCRQKHRGFCSHNSKVCKHMWFIKWISSKLSNTLECSVLHLIEAFGEAAWLILWHSTHLKGLIDLYSESWVVTYDPES